MRAVPCQWACSGSHGRRRPGRSPYVAAHRRGTGLGLAARPCPRGAPGEGRAAGGQKDEGPVAERAGPDFAGLLRRLRDEAGLTQEELAEAARVSQRAVSDLERGINRTARKDTALLLAGALGLDGQAGELFVAAARGKAPASQVLTVFQLGSVPGRPEAVAGLPVSLPPRPALLAGREELLAGLESRLSDGDGAGPRIVVLSGLGGAGKTSVAVEYAHRHLAGVGLAWQFPAEDREVLEAEVAR